MTQTPGWYPDPAPTAPGAPAGLRWWDGGQWTEHVQAPYQMPVAPALAAAPPIVAYGRPIRVTPDGQPLAGWWSRVAATLIDGLLLGLVTGALAFPFVGRLISAYTDFINETLDASEQGTTPPNAMDLYPEIWAPLLVISLIGLAVNLAYTFGFLRWRAATPGKMALGLQVRLRETPGQLSYGTIGRRWLGQNIASLLGLIPLVGGIASVYPLLDSLWPLWDDKSQALHDKFAKTNVVKRVS